MNKRENLQTTFFKIKTMLFRQFLGGLITGLFLAGLSAGYSLKQELRKGQAVARVQTILKNNATGCRLRTRSISAVRVGAGWRVTARVVMSVSGSPVNETAIWIVSRRNGAVAQNQLTAEIAMGCP